MDPQVCSCSDELEKLRKKVAELEEEKGELRRQLDNNRHHVVDDVVDEEINRISDAAYAYREKMLICSCPTACRFSPPDCPAASTSSLIELNRMLALLEKTPALRGHPRRLEAMAALELSWKPLWHPKVFVLGRKCVLFELTIVDVMSRAINAPEMRRKCCDDDAGNEAVGAYRRRMLICRCPTACRFSPHVCPAASTSSLIELNRMLALLERNPALSADAPLLEALAKFELPWTPVWKPTALIMAWNWCPVVALTVADMLNNCVRKCDDAETVRSEAEAKKRAYRKKMLICRCPTACRFSPPVCPAASTSSLLELNRMLALLEKTPALSSDARRLKEMAKREETCAALWQPTLLEVAGVCPLFELTVAAQPDLSELLRQRHGVLLDALSQVTLPKVAVLVMSGVEAEEVPVLDGFDKYVVDGGGTMCDELCRVLTRKAIRRVLLVVPFHASTAHRSTWQSVIDRIPIRTDVMFCAAALSPQRDITAGHDDEFDRLMRRLGRVDGKAEHLSLAPVLIRRLNTFRHCDAEHFGRLFWSRIGRRLEELHWPRMFEVLGEQEEAELEAEAARRMLESQQVENAEKQAQSGTVWDCVKSTLKNIIEKMNY